MVFVPRSNPRGSPLLEPGTWELAGQGKTSPLRGLGSTLESPGGRQQQVLWSQSEAGANEAQTSESCMDRSGKCRSPEIGGGALLPWGPEMKGVGE